MGELNASCLPGDSLVMGHGCHPAQFGCIQGWWVRDQSPGLRWGWRPGEPAALLQHLIPVGRDHWNIGSDPGAPSSICPEPY